MEVKIILWHYLMMSTQTYLDMFIEILGAESPNLFLEWNF